MLVSVWSPYIDSDVTVTQRYLFVTWMQAHPTLTWAGGTFELEKAEWVKSKCFDCSIIEIPGVNFCSQFHLNMFFNKRKKRFSTGYSMSWVKSSSLC